MPALSLPILFGLGELAPSKRRALTLVFASSMALMMGVNFIQPALPAMTQAFGISDSALGLVMTVYTGPAIILAPLFGIVAKRILPARSYPAFMAGRPRSRRGIILRPGTKSDRFPRTSGNNFHHPIGSGFANCLSPLNSQSPRERREG